MSRVRDRSWIGGGITVELELELIEQPDQICSGCLVSAWASGPGILSTTP
jgi:hypothetical protein